jgi:YbbR domain-containing protein
MIRFLKQNLLENWILKTLAIFLALVLWLFVRNESGPVRMVAVPLEVRVPQHMEISNERPASVGVMLRGTTFSNMWFGQPLPTCIIDLQSAKEGKHIVELTPDNVNAPKGLGVEVLQVNPTRIVLELERTVSKEVPIVVPVQGQVADGFEIYEKSANPTAAVVTGPRSRVEPIPDISTEVVFVSGQKQSASFLVGLKPKDSAIRISASNPIQVKIQIGPNRKKPRITKITE